ncbi:MAG TPA: hypothetical protein VNO54_26610 [Streptosporangiaceae bacterium]|nr:hypothetical protein [Streptosporangiaceae bacterium]
MSDYLGRRRVILAALTVCACGLFLAAHGIVLLFACRVSPSARRLARSARR